MSETTMETLGLEPVTYEDAEVAINEYVNQATTGEEMVLRIARMKLVVATNEAALKICTWAGLDPKAPQPRARDARESE